MPDGKVTEGAGSWEEGPGSRPQVDPLRWGGGLSTEFSYENPSLFSFLQKGVCNI